MIKLRCASLRRCLSASTLLGLLVLLIGAPSVKAQWTTNGNNINNTNTGNVGVGTTTPNVKLAVNGSGTNVYNTDAWIENNMHVQGNETLTQGGRGRLRIGTAWGYVGLYADSSSTGAANDLILGSGSGNVRVGPGVGGVVQNLILPSGSVGLGTTAPGALVDLASTTQINNRLLLSGQMFFAAGNSSTSGVALRLGTNRAGERQLWFADSAQAVNSTNAQLRMRFFSNLASLDALTTDGTDVRPLILQSVGGNVGIGTTAPSSPLEVSKSQAAATVLQVTNSNTSAGNAAAMRMFTSGNNALTLSATGNAGSGGYAAITQEANLPLVFQTNLTERLRIAADGNVGIGTTSPTAKLHVAGDGKVTGNLTVDGNIAAKYQDVAEWVPAARALPPGTVVTLNRTQSNLVEASSKAYDTRVAGVISEQPGITLGEKGKNKVLVATTGRVRIKVDATNAPIEIGDLLVTSEKEGVAMKSLPVNVGGVEIHRPGTLIGKALEPLAKGQGEILVLLSLQ